MESRSNMTQDELKTLVGRAALQWVPAGQIVGVGTGSTVNKFIDALATIRHTIRGAVSSSVASSERLVAAGIPVFELADVPEMAIYIDGADEIAPGGFMVKGGGAALTREKIVAAQARQFVCIVDESKWVTQLGWFPLPVEVVPMAAPHIMRRFAQMGGQARVRLDATTGQALVTDNGQCIIDVTGLQIADPTALEMTVSQWPGVVTVGVFAVQRAHICLLGGSEGVKVMHF